MTSSNDQGRIAVITGASRAGNGVYAATKWGLNGWSESLRRELRRSHRRRHNADSASVIDDYAETAGKRRKDNTAHGTQPGDPARAAQAIITAVEADEPPTLLMLGPDALGAIRSVFDAQLAELRAWEQTSLSTDLQH